MANSRQYNVIFIDTTNYSTDTNLEIVAIKYIGAASGTAAITAGTTGSGAPLWQDSGAANSHTSNETPIRAKQGIHVAVTNGAKVYIYLR